ncbi:MAG: hypothetical protein L3J00_04975 [Thiomicrorhabdus sp.]|nr:hypothetical protein [Thiomicrorhabdus sp.]
MKNFLFTFMCIFFSSTSLSVYANTLNEIEKGSNLQYFGFWGGYYWGIDSRGKNGSHLYYDFLSQTNNDSHLIGVGAGRNDPSTGVDCTNTINVLSERLCIIGAKLDTIIRLNQNQKYKVLLSIENILFERPAGRPGKHLQSWSQLILDANSILLSEGEDPITVPRHTASPSVKNMAAIKAVIKALSVKVFDRHNDRTELVEMITLIDEPYISLNYNDASSMNNMYSLQRWINWELNASSSLKSKKRYVNFTKKLVSDHTENGKSLRNVLPWDYDYVSFNCYRSCSFEEIASITKKLMKNNWSHQKVIMIPYAGAQVPWEYCDSRYPWMKNHLSWVNRNLIQYFNYAASPQNSEIVGLLPFFWYDTVNSDDQFCGAYRYPEQIEILKDISEKITNYVNKR